MSLLDNRLQNTDKAETEVFFSRDSNSFVRLSALNCHQVSDAQCSTVHSIRAQNHHAEAGWAEDTVLSAGCLHQARGFITSLDLQGGGDTAAHFLKDEFTNDQRG